MHLHGKLFFILALVAVCWCADDGKYRPEVAPVTSAPVITYRDPYYNVNDGRYSSRRYITNVDEPVVTTLKPIGNPTIRQAVYPNYYRTPNQYRPFGAGTAFGATQWDTSRNTKIIGRDGYRYRFETGTGVVAEETGGLVKIGLNEETLRAEGFYQYTGEDGIVNRVDYVADENGFTAKGDQNPKIPPAILRVLDHLTKQSRRIQKY